MNKKTDNSWVWWIVIFGGMWLCGQVTGAKSDLSPTSTPGAVISSSGYDFIHESQRATALMELTQSASDTFAEINSDLPGESCPNGCTYHIAGCDIKGNISFDTKEKIYHLPGQEYYDATEVNPSYGEFWFCTEQEAMRNGFRRAYK